MSLKTWNCTAAVLHTGLAFWTYKTLPDKLVTLYKVKYEVDSTPLSDLDYAMTLEEDTTRNIRIFTIAFFAITALFHLVYATDYKGIYSKAIFGYGWNPFRWIEYSITASIMIYVIALVAGAKDTSSSLIAALLTPGLMLQGLTVERELHQNALADWSTGLRKERPNVDPILVWANFLPAWFFFGIKWYIIWNAYLQLKQQLKEENKDLDPQITELVYIQFIGFTLFGVIQSVQVYSWTRLSKGHWSQTKYINYEKAYIVLSFIVKAALGISVARLLN